MAPQMINIFKETFEKNSQPNSQERVEFLNEKFDNLYNEKFGSHDHNCNCHEYQVTDAIFIDAVYSLQKGKCCDDMGINAEHFLFAPIAFLQRMKFLFISLLHHTFVPSQFKSGFITPLVKDQCGNKASSDNYRGITISPIMSKILEHVLRILFCDNLKTSDLQFGFKRKSSTIHALHLMKEVVNSYTNSGSSVYMAYLDASKAFDRVVHKGLFIKLIERSFPKMIVDLIMTWYSDLQCRVRWGSAFSDWFSLKVGVRQDGVLSPSFYSLYVDDLILKMKDLKIGCYLCDLFAAIIMYADDMLILSPTVRGLQTLLLSCQEYCDFWDIKLNPKKSRIMYFGKGYVNLCQVKLNDRPLELVSTWKYLGVDVKSGRDFSFTCENSIKKFYRCANAILRIGGQARELALLKLVESHCLPILTYGGGIVFMFEK